MLGDGVFRPWTKVKRQGTTLPIDLQLDRAWAIWIASSAHLDRAWSFTTQTANNLPFDFTGTSESKK